MAFSIYLHFQSNSKWKSAITHAIHNWNISNCEMYKSFSYFIKSILLIVCHFELHNANILSMNSNPLFVWGTSYKTFLHALFFSQYELFFSPKIHMKNSRSTLNLQMKQTEWWEQYKVCNANGCPKKDSAWTSHVIDLKSGCFRDESM